MRAVPVVIEADGRLRLAPEISLPPGTQLAVFVYDAKAGADDITTDEMMRLAEASGAFDFLKDEPNLYSLDDIKPEDRNPDYRGNAPGS